MSEPTLVPAPKRRMSVLLIVSLCLNVALVAMIAVWVVGNAQEEREKRGPLSLAELTERASPGEREAIEAVVSAHAERLKELRQSAGRAHGDTLRALAATPFDRDRFMQSLARAHTADDAVRDEMSNLTADAVAKLSPDERKAIARDARRRALLKFMRTLNLRAL